MRKVIDSIRGEYDRYKGLGDGAVRQVDDQALSTPGPNGSNSLAVICWHISGNLQSRFTDFLTSDGEKPWRNREEEFDERAVTREGFLAKWERGWSTLFAALDALTDTSYHVGQMVYLAKALRGDAWASLSIARGQSQNYVPKTARG